METRKDSLSSLKLCRFCLCQDETLSSLYDGARAPKNSVPLSLKILSCVSIEVFPSDKMPSYICNRCKFFMELSYEYKQICRQADEKILQYVQNAVPLESVAWPLPLIKILRSEDKPTTRRVMKTIVEGGATIQVSAHDTDSDEDDDENVFNVKLGDGSDDENKNARVKLVTTAKQGKDKSKKDMEEDDRAECRSLGDVPEGCWPCDLCDCTFPLEQLLDLHKRQKHRERTVECDKCDAKFFSPYDLMTHQLCHSDEVMFECVACDKKFKRLIRLKRHEKTAHSDLAQQPCPHCPASFLSLEELEAHQKKHNRISERRYACSICDKRFHEKSTLQRHEENVHNKSPEFSCEYCPQRFTTVSKLTKHVRAHAGERAYPCKHCNKSFLKSHHYTRHLRVKHRETIRSSRGPFGESDQYRCEQCEDTFSTQDELIYHSAIHATQNLTCPLCQEKFDDVDAVTAHIKSHVNGTEFMCDLCELVFTSKEKLDNHITVAHDDEIRNSEETGQDESSMEMDEEEEDDNTINVKDEGDHMVVEIKKPDEFMLRNVMETEDADDKMDNTNSEESEAETTYTELSTVDTLAIAKKDTSKHADKAANIPATITKTSLTAIRAEKMDTQTTNFLRKAEEIKGKNVQPESSKKEKTNNKNEGSASDKSLRLLEKELQELKRTNTRSDAVKTPVKIESLRNRRPQIHTSTPKVRTLIEEKKVQVTAKAPTLERKVIERRVFTKENKEPKDTKEKASNGSNKEDKEAKEDAKKETPKSVVKNGTNDKNSAEEGIRRSTRPSKIKDYAKMIRDRSQDSSEVEDSDEDEEYKEIEKSIERSKVRRNSKGGAKPPPGTRKRGRPRKEPPAPPKVRKEEIDEEDTADKVDSEPESRSKDATSTIEDTDNKESVPEKKSEPIKAPEPKPASGVLVSPTGQTLKKIPIKALPPGVKPLPLPVNARPVGSGEVCEMQIGKKVVKVQKIVMTKAEVEAMAKKGLVEMKDGTMVLKQGIKLPTTDPATLKTSLVGEDLKESPTKKEKATPTRCDFGDDS